MIIRGGNLSIKGEVRVPGDKSISHRAIMIGSIAEGKTIIHNFLMGEDCLSTVDCFRKLGVNIFISDEDVIVEGVGLYGLKESKDILYVGNSGTTIRLISGILAGQNFSSTITGDESIQKRPMDRIINPLKMMGANISGLLNKFPPLRIKPTKKLIGVEYRQPIPSAQVKSCILLAGLYADSDTKILQPSMSRDHTERMLKYFGANIVTKDNEVYLKPGNKLIGKEIYIPGDISSAAFLIVGTLILKGSKLLIRDVGLNETRTGILDVLIRMGGRIKILNERNLNNEPVGDILVEYSELKGIDIKGNMIPRLIDEIPIIAVAATQARGTTVIKNAEELKVKESNRIKAIVNELKKMGADIEELDDGMIINGPSKLRPSNLKTYNDHRIAMSLIIAALSADGDSNLQEIESIKISFPNFFDILKSIIQRI
ncbi:3-phosphoshikimate 1-carboxyvinyltransferase [Caloranaerobacter azorensis DSM 13643]|uniref:3-phosphoshikimate 1-carboxyvinyltransferase n=1 Tax=Caloranaerobacter azorensis DSM 13643 TaxID=1121264 RepID=A0A1M5WKR6_9FIRM|nr:3-phosphoshikimate 1-carboxyvinyltransferase [Caloranaerobacter azorensis]SHH88038.1 3-phosphoshikimate 1-carboxyvinyltransferase [Caloranaerobacter azorensis DSM 13643]